MPGARWGVACGAPRAPGEERAAGTAWRTLGRGVRRSARPGERSGRLGMLGARWGVACGALRAPGEERSAELLGARWGVACGALRAPERAREKERKRERLELWWIDPGLGLG